MATPILGNPSHRSASHRSGRVVSPSPLRTILTALALLALAITGAACDENPVGRKCFIGLDAGTPNQAIIGSPALECQSRTCLQVPEPASLPEGSEYSPLCTAECQADSDCDRVPESPCQTGFTCAVPVVVGSFCCRKVCVCKDYLEDGVLPEPAACDPDDERNTCCNLPGRGECL
ncbi:hypothetical protein [Haliangium sp.]|uniref:hypothetical protein n=1 Tax=Haliangium sp. TaxID=2663208 RepID=UPI003D0BEB6E